MSKWEDLHPDDQDLIWWWEQQEPAQSPHLIDPEVKKAVEEKRAKKKEQPTGAQGIAAISDE